MSVTSRRLAATLSLAVSAALVLTACGGSDSGDSDSGGSGGSSGSEDSFVVGISIPQGAQPILKATVDAFTAAAELDGITVKPLDAQLNPSKQVTDIDQFVAQQVDAIVVYPLDANSLTPALDRAEKAGIDLIGWAAIAKDGDAGAYASNVDTGGSYRGSGLLADYVKEQTGGEGNVLGVGLGIPVPALEVMMSGYEDGVTEGSDMTWLGRVDNPTVDVAGAQKVVSSALTKYQNDVQVVMAYNDSSSIGASVALKEAGIDDALIVGQNGDQDGIAAVTDGRTDATIDLVPWRTGLMLETVTRAVLGGEEVPVWVESPTDLYTADNVGDYLPWPDALSQIESGDISCADGGGCPDDIAALDG